MLLYCGAVIGDKDVILTNGLLRYASCESVMTSDHRPVTAEFRLAYAAAEHFQLQVASILPHSTPLFVAPSPHT